MAISKLFQGESRHAVGLAQAVEPGILLEQGDEARRLVGILEEGPANNLDSLS